MVWKTDASQVEGFNALAMMAPMEARRRQQAGNALAAMAMENPRFAAAMSDPVQYNALASFGGPTVAAAEAVSAGRNAPSANYDISASGDVLGKGIIETANALGIDPLDLATVISYETGGTFDPTKRGPTTQWGQHRGLIQFGEPQAREYGVDWNDPLGSQLGPDGAVAKYLRGSGLKPGMGILDLYSTINAGAPGLYHRSDANNGGAPGTVADKVNNQMAGHRKKAEALLAPFIAQAEAFDPLLARYGL